MKITHRWTQVLDELKAQGRYRTLCMPCGIDFTSNDYLGYSSRLNCPNVEDGCGSQSGLASRLLRGHHPIWEEVESLLAGWHGAEAALMMTSGYCANEGLLSTLIEPGDWVASDERNHASIIDGLRLSRPRKFLFKHNDLNHLEHGLKAETANQSDGRGRFIVTESLFSMDGDMAPLSEIVKLAERYGAHVIVDEAHTTGCFGLQGSGCVDAYELRNRVLATVHTGGKALGLVGAYICCSQLLKEYLINRCRHFIYTTALPQVVGTWWRKRIPQVQADEQARQRLHSNSAILRSDLSLRGIESPGHHYIVPVIIGRDQATLHVARYLQELGYDIRAIRPPTVQDGTCRLRISIHADHHPHVLKALSSHIDQVCRL